MPAKAFFDTNVLVYRSQLIEQQMLILNPFKVAVPETSNPRNPQ